MIGNSAIAIFTSTLSLSTREKALSRIFKLMMNRNNLRLYLISQYLLWIRKITTLGSNLITEIWRINWMKENTRMIIKNSMSHLKVNWIYRLNIWIRKCKHWGTIPHIACSNSKKVLTMNIWLILRHFRNVNRCISKIKIIFWVKSNSFKRLWRNS